ncbi:hypothetical protein Hanom_Chr06g00526031 [Helianthus anomalus]
MAQEATNPDFDRSAWDVTSWKRTLLKLGGEEEPEPVKTTEAGTSGAKEMAGGACGDIVGGGGCDNGQ